MKVTTESGAIYEFKGKQVRRLGNASTMRRDECWLTLFNKFTPVVGESMKLTLEPLAEDASFTVRYTTPVASIEKKSHA